MLCCSAVLKRLTKAHPLKALCSAAFGGMKMTLNVAETKR